MIKVLKINMAAFTGEVKNNQPVNNNYNLISYVALPNLSQATWWISAMLLND